MNLDTSDIFWIIIILNFIFGLFKKKEDEEPVVNQNPFDEQWGSQTQQGAEEEGWEDAEHWDPARWVEDNVDSSLSSQEVENTLMNSDLTTPSAMDDPLINRVIVLQNNNKKQQRELVQLPSQLQVLTQLHDQIDDLLDEVVNTRKSDRSEIKDFRRDTQLTDTVDQLEIQLTTLAHFYQSTLDELSSHELTARLLKYIISPLLHFRHAESVDLPQTWIPYPEHLYNVPRVLDQTLQLSPENQVISVPVDFDEVDNLLDWPQLAGDIAQRLDRVLPSWVSERHRVLGHLHRVQLPVKERRKLKWAVQDSLALWSDSLWSDLMCVYRFGPIGAKSLIQSFDSWDDHSIRLLTPQSPNSDLQDRHPPPIIRVEAILTLLRLSGHITEADELIKNWRERTNNEVLVTLRNKKVISFSFELVAQEVSLWVHRLYEQTWNTWAGHSLSDVPGFECTPSIWKRILELSQQVNEHDTEIRLIESLRWLVLIHLAQQNPGKMVYLNRLAKSKHIDDLISSAPQQDLETDLIAALLLPGLLSRPHFGAQMLRQGRATFSNQNG